MAVAASIVIVGTSATALNAGDVTNMVIKNLSLVTIYVGVTGVGNQTFPVSGGSELRLTLAASDRVFALAQAANTRVALITS